MIYHKYRFGFKGNFKVFLCKIFGHRLNENPETLNCERCGLYYQECYYPDDYLVKSGILKKDDNGCLYGKTEGQKSDFFKSLFEFRITDPIFYNEQLYDLKPKEIEELNKWIDDAHSSSEYVKIKDRLYLEDGFDNDGNPINGRFSDVYLKKSELNN